MATVEDIRDVMRDEYPHLEPSIPEIGRFVKFTYYDPDTLYVTLDIDEKTIHYSTFDSQLSVEYKLAMVGDNSGQWTLGMAISDSQREESFFSWEYVDSA